MKKFLIILVSILGTLFAIALIICIFFWAQNNEASKKAAIGEDAKVFESLINKYQVSYPKNLFMLSGENGSVLPAKLRLANFEKFDSKPANNSYYDIIVLIDQNCKAINDCPVVKDLEGQKFISKPATLNGVTAVRLTNLENMGKTVVSTLALWEGKVYQLNFTPATITSYEESKATYDNLLSNFQFSQNQITGFLGIKKACAATTCDTIDQQYAPGTFLVREPLRTTNDTGQTFRPTQNSICKIGVELENVDSNQTATIWLYTGSGTLLVQKTQPVSSGWNYFTLDSSVSVTPEAEYVIKININGTAGPGKNLWQAGEQGKSDGYPRGHAIIAGFDEQDLDFHFKEYYSITTDDGGGDGGGGDEPGNGGGETEEPIVSPTSTNPKTTAPTVPEIKNTAAPKKPFNLNIVRLWLTGLDRTYVDLSWDKVTDEDLAGYLIYYGAKSHNYYYTIDNGTANTIRVNNLLPGGTYYFVARAYDKSGNLSEPSNEVTANLVRNIISNYWWVLVILGGILLASIIYLIILKKKETKISI